MAGKRFGGFGGHPDTVPFADYGGDDFAQALSRACGARIRASEDDASAVWASLSNVAWTRGEDVADYSFRAAGDLVASIRGEGDYLDWYCSGPECNVAPWIADAMRAEGWTAKPLGVDG